MTDAQPGQTGLINYLANLARDDNRAALAALRRGLGRPPGTAPELFPHVARFFPIVPEHGSRAREDAMFIVAALFGAHPHHRADAGSPLKVLRQIQTDNKSDSTSIERRILALLDADAQTLPTHLRHLISLVHSDPSERSLDYQQLLRDVTNWNSERRWVQRAWAHDWWAGQVPRDDGVASDDDGSDADGAEMST